MSMEEAMARPSRDPGPPELWRGLDRRALMERPEILGAALRLLADATAEFRRRLADVPLEGLVEVFTYTDSFGCFFDPTGWRTNRDERKFNAALVEAAMEYHHAVGRLICDRQRCRQIHGCILLGHPCPVCGLPGAGKAEGPTT